KSPALPGIPAQYSVATSVVLWRGLHSISASALPQSFFSRPSSAVSSDHAIMLKWSRIEERPQLWASFRYFSIHSLLMWLARLYRAKECILRADFSNFCRLASLLSKNKYWL